MKKWEFQKLFPEHQRQNPSWITLDEMLWPEGKEPKAAWAVAEKLGLAVEQELSLSTGPFAWPDIGNITSDTARFAETLLEAYEEHGVVKR
jgi:hypothetical protein